MRVYICLSHIYGDIYVHIYLYIDMRKRNYIHILYFLGNIYQGRVNGYIYI